jgi:hypothetical protein
MGDDLVACAAMCQDRYLVAHRAGRQEHRGLLAQKRGHPIAQLVHRRIVAMLLVADLGAYHGVLHRRRWPGLGIGIQVHPHWWQIGRRALRGVEHGAISGLHQFFTASGGMSVASGGPYTSRARF